MSHLSSMLILLLFLSVIFVSFSQIETVKSEGTIYIRGDGSVEETNKISQSEGNIYTFTGDIFGEIKVQRGNCVIDGAGYSLQGNWTVSANYTLQGTEEVRGIDLSNGRGQDPSRSEVFNVTIKNLKIANFYYGIDNSNTENNTFIGNHVTDCDTGFWIVGSSNNELIYNTITDCKMGISIKYAGLNIITKNNLDASLGVWLSVIPIVDRNYWSSYSGTDHERDGIGDTPYLYQDPYEDSRPLMGPIAFFDAGIWDGTSYYIEVSSNSTVSDLSFDAENARILFTVTGENGTTGFCRVTIPKDLLYAESEWVVLVDGNPITLTINEGSKNVRETYLYFEYLHSSKTVAILGTYVIPEFPSWTSLLTSVVAVVVTVVYRQKLKKQEAV